MEAKRSPLRSRAGTRASRDYRRIGAFVLLSLISSLVQADPIDDVIRTSMAKDHIPGVAVGIVKDGKLVVARGYGVANLETGTPVTPDTVFRIASMSKGFTAESILLLQEEGKLSVYDPISKYLSDLPDAWKGITIRDLLTHQSGIHEINDAKGYDFRDDSTPAQLLEILRPLPLDFETGTRFKYSNSGYYLLGWIVEKASGQSLKAFAESRIFSPIGMTKTSYYRQPDIVPNRAEAYRWVRDHYENGWPERSAAGDGSGAVLTTLGDWAKYDLALDAGTPVSKAIQREMGTRKPFKNGKPSPYGYALYEGQDGATFHTGSSYGFTSAFIRDPKRRITVFVFRNSNGGPALEMANAVRLAYDPTLKPIGRLDATPPPARTSDAEPNPRAG